MLPSIDFTTTQSYKYLADHYIDIAAQNLKDLFKSDPQRFINSQRSLKIYCSIIQKTASPTKLLPC